MMSHERSWGVLSIIRHHLQLNLLDAVHIIEHRLAALVSTRCARLALLARASLLLLASPELDKGLDRASSSEQGRLRDEKRLQGCVKAFDEVVCWRV